MMMSNIEWTGDTWNPVAGCSIKSPGCTNCYAMKMARWIEKMGSTNLYDGTTMPSKSGPVWTGKLAFSEKALLEPLRRKKPQTYFVNSMGDLFHENCPDEWIDRVFAVMALCPQHTFQVLTKRGDRMREYFTAQPKPEKYRDILPDGSERPTPASFWRSHSAMVDMIRHVPARQLNYAAEVAEREGRDGFMPQWPLPNVWLGVSVEDQKRADERIPDLLATPAAVRFLSCEPLLGSLDLENIENPDPDSEWDTIDALTGNGSNTEFQYGETFEFESLDWIIVGGESGPGAREFDPAWARSIRDQCADAGVPFFMKQMGGKSKAHMPAIPVDLMIRQFPERTQ